MANAKTVNVRHTHTSEIREVTPDERATLDPDYWVIVTGEVTPQAAETAAPKTTPKADGKE